MVKLESEMIRWGKLLFERRLISGWGGNLSCRLDEHKFLITGQHAPLGFLRTEQLVRIDQNGRPEVEGQKPSSETPMFTLCTNLLFSRTGKPPRKTRQNMLCLCANSIPN